MWGGNTLRYMSCNCLGLIKFNEWQCYGVGETDKEVTLLSFNGKPVVIPNNLVVGITKQHPERRAVTAGNPTAAKKQILLHRQPASSLTYYSLNGCPHDS